MWKPIRGFEHLYIVRSNGEVWRRRGFWCRADRPVALQKGRYARVSLWRNGDRTPVRPLVHRLVYEHFVGPIPPGMTINHKNGNRRDNRVTNLELATMSEQMRHAYATGLQKRAKGEARKNVAKLTERQVREIRKLYAFRHVTGKYLAARYGVSPACIWSVVRGDRWSHVK